MCLYLQKENQKHWNDKKETNKTGFPEAIVE